MSGWGAAACDARAMPLRSRPPSRAFRGFASAACRGTRAGSRSTPIARDARAGAEAAAERRSAAVRAIEQAGLAVEVVSGGGTGTWDMTGRARRVTELQAGSYVFMDTLHLAVVPDLDVSLVVLATSRRIGITGSIHRSRLEAWATG